MRISKITPKSNYCLEIITTQKKRGVFDVKPYLKYEPFSPLKDIKTFKNCRNGGYYIEWDCGADLSADTIEKRWKVEESASVGRR